MKLTNPIMHIMFIGLRIQILCVTILDLSKAELSAARTLCTNDLLTSRLVLQKPQVDCFPTLQMGGMACRALSSNAAIPPICCEQGDLSQPRFAEHACASADLAWQHPFPRPSATELRACPPPQGNLTVRTRRHAYAATESAVSTTTTLPDVLNFFWFRPSSPISEKNCLFPCCLRNREISRTPAP